MRKATLAAVLLLLPVTLLAQNANVSGTVADASGALIPGVQVDARNINTGVVNTRITNEAGAYGFPSLQPGAYTVSASLPGFQTATYEDVALGQNAQVRLDFALEVAGVATTVEVVVDADVVLATTSASVGDALPESEITTLPLATRDVTALISNIAGAQGSYFGGQRRGNVNTTRDGLPMVSTRYQNFTDVDNVSTYTSPDLVEEIVVEVASMDASSGRGSTQVRLQTRSGTNEFHGALFYSNRNSALSAFPYFDKLNQTNPEKPYENGNQYGGRLGGPIVENKAFFFVLYEGQRFLEKEFTVASVLTPQAAQGNFRYFEGRRNGNVFSSTPSVDINGQPLTGIGTLRTFNVFSDVTDANRTALDTVFMQGLLAQMPTANDFTIGDGLNTAGFRWNKIIKGAAGNRSLTGGQAAAVTGQDANRDQLNLRFDYQINDDHRVNFTTTREEAWGKSSQSGVAPWPGGPEGEVRMKPGVYTAGWTATVSPTVLNELRFGRQNSAIDQRGAFGVGCCFGDSSLDFTDEGLAAQALHPSSNGYPLYVDPQLLTDDNIVVHGTGSNRGQVSPLWRFSDTVSWAQGSHSFQVGAEAVFQESDGWNMVNVQWPEGALGEGNFPVPTGATGIGPTNPAIPGIDPNDAVNAINLLEDLSGSLDQIQQGFHVQSSQPGSLYQDFLVDMRRFRAWHQNDWAVFWKDTWQVTPDLTLNLGLRYDKFGVIWEENGLAPQPIGGEAGIFGISGSDFSAWMDPTASGGSLTAVEFVGKHSPNSDQLFYDNDWNNFAPSFGFSYRLPTDRQIVLRGGYGVNYSGVPTFLNFDIPFGGTPGGGLTETAPLTTYTDLSNFQLPLSTSAAPFAAIPIDSNSRNSIDFDAFANDRVIPYVQNFNLSLQTEIVNNLTLEVSYIGNKTTKLWQTQELNEPNINASWQGSETFLQAFNETRAGGTAPLFDAMLDGIGGVGTTTTGSAFLRNFGSTDDLIANGEVGQLGEYMTSANFGCGVRGCWLRDNGFPENFFYVNPQFDDAQLWGNGGLNATYHSLETQITQRLTSGFSGSFTYTWSKALGNSQSEGSDTNVTTLDPLNRRANYGPLSFDRTHSVNMRGSWTLPFGAGQAFLSGAPSVVQRIVEGWNLSGTASWRSGAPIDIETERETVGSNSFEGVPDVVGSFPKDTGEVFVGDGNIQYFNGLSSVPASTAIFGADPDNLAAHFTNRDIVDSSGNIVLTNAQPGHVGNLGVYPFRGPARLNFNMALSKRVQITEGVSFTLRADAINVLNSPNWGDPENRMTRSDFGSIGAGPNGTNQIGNRTFTINSRIDF